MLGSRFSNSRGLSSLPDFFPQVSAPLGLSMQYNDENKLFVGGLPWALDSDDLREVGPPPAHGPVPILVFGFLPTPPRAPAADATFFSSHAGLPGVWGYRAGQRRFRPRDWSQQVRFIPSHKAVERAVVVGYWHECR